MSTIIAIISSLIALLSLSFTVFIYVKAKKDKHQDQMNRKVQILEIENEHLKRENDRCKRQLSTYDKMNFKDGIYFFKEDEKSEIPVCPVCYGNEEKVIPLSQINNGYKYTCQRCNGKFGDSTREQDFFDTSKSEYNKELEDIIHYNPFT